MIQMEIQSLVQTVMIDMNKRSLNCLKTTMQPSKQYSSRNDTFSISHYVCITCILFSPYLSELKAFSVHPLE